MRILFIGVTLLLASCTPDDGVPTPSTGSTGLSVIQIDLGDEGNPVPDQTGEMYGQGVVYLFTDRGGVRQCDFWNEKTHEYERHPCDGWELPMCSFDGSGPFPCCASGSYMNGNLDCHEIVDRWEAPELSPEEVDNGPLEDRMLEPVDDE